LAFWPGPAEGDLRIGVVELDVVGEGLRRLVDDWERG
jgi:hypothetical protein